MEFAVLLLILLFAPVVMAIVGIAFLFSSDIKRKRKGRNLLLGGILLLLIEILIGYTVCSNMNFGGMH